MLQYFLIAEACNFIEEETLAQVFYCEFCEISKKHLRWLLLNYTIEVTPDIFFFDNKIILIPRM